VQVVRVELGASLALWRALELVSLKLTELAGRACWELGLDPCAGVLASLERFCEDEEYGREVCGRYDPVRRLILVSLPCLVEGDLAERLAETLAHELVHHCQFTRGRLCEVHLDPELAAKMDMALPYRLRPHEVEAYERQRDLAERLRGVRGFDEAVGYARRLLSPEVVPPLSEVATALSWTPALIESAEFIVELAGGDLLLSMRGIAEKLRGVENEAKRACLERAITRFLRELEEDPVGAVAEELRSVVREFLGNVKAIIVDSGTALSRAYVVLSSGAAVGFDLKEGPLPPLSLLLKSKQEPKFRELGEMRVEPAQIVQGAFEAGGYEFKAEVLQRKTAAECLREELRRARKEPSFSASDLLALLSLGGWKAQALGTRRLGDAEYLAVSVEAGSAGRAELLVPSDARVKDERLRIDAPLRDAAEKLKDRERARDFIVKYFEKRSRDFIVRYFKKKYYEDLWLCIKLEEIEKLLKQLEEQINM
jgi:hypothetical protein